ncbi:MAG TPA: cupin domain-containing protein [Alphaproteobacteria bacterium]|nr:cupin domain-containing protein [Alphaproteobacteria bacterium]
MPKSRVVQPDEGASFWQPVPANGHVEVKVEGGRDGMADFDCGVQEVAPGCHVREHAHGENEELIMVFAGEGEALVDGETHRMQPGTVLYLAKDSRHLFRNTGAEPMRFFWTLLPGGLAPFFRAIGRDRLPGEPAPQPFPRPDDVAQIEQRTVFRKLD